MKSVKTGHLAGVCETDAPSPITGASHSVPDAAYRSRKSVGCIARPSQVCVGLEERTPSTPSDKTLAQRPLAGSAE